MLRSERSRECSTLHLRLLSPREKTPEARASVRAPEEMPEVMCGLKRHSVLGSRLISAIALHWNERAADVLSRSGEAARIPHMPFRWSTRLSCIAMRLEEGRK